MLTYERRPASRTAKPSDASLARILRAVASGDWTHAGFEREICQDAERSSGNVRYGNSPNSATIPIELLARRDLTVGTPTAGGNLVATEVDPFAASLTPRSIALRAGAQMLTGLRGNLVLPRVAAGVTAGWLATEATAAPETDPTIAKATLTPKVVGAYTEASRLLLQQGGPAVERMIAGELLSAVGVALDIGVLQGSGTAGQPTGILGTAGVGTFSGTALGLAALLNAQEDVATAASALPDAQFAWVTTPAVSSLLKQRQKFSSTDTPLWAGALMLGEIEGVTAYASPNMPTASMVYGDWHSVVIGQWGTLEVAHNPYAGFKEGIHGFRVLLSADVAIRHPSAFTVATSIT